MPAVPSQSKLLAVAAWSGAAAPGCDNETRNGGAAKGVRELGAVRHTRITYSITHSISQAYAGSAGDPGQPTAPPLSPDRVGMGPRTHQATAKESRSIDAD